MCDSHVSGNQLASWPVVKAQAAPDEVSPDRTCGFAVTYSGSSCVRKPWVRTWAYTSVVATASATTDRRGRPT